MNKFDILLVMFSMLFYQFGCIKIGLLDDTSTLGTNSRINNAFDKYADVARAYGNDLKFEKYQYDYQNDVFSNVWKKIENNETGVDVAVSSCNFLVNDNSLEKYSVISDSSVTLWCGCEDFLSICIKNVYFYSSIAENLIYHKSNQKLLILSDESKKSSSYFEYFNDVVTTLGVQSIVENITVSESITNNEKTAVAAKLDPGVEVVDLLSEANSIALLPTIASKTDLTVYHSPLLSEQDSLSDNLNTHYHLLSVINSLDIQSSNISRIRDILYGPNSNQILKHDEVEFTIVLSTVFQIFSKIRNSNYLAIIGSSLLSEFDTYINRIKIMNDFHFDADYYIGKYNSGTLEYVYTQNNNWYDVYYRYGKPDVERQCNYFNGISTTTSSSKSTAIILIFLSDLTYSEKDSNENVYELMMMMQEVSDIERHGNISITSDLVVEPAIVPYSEDERIIKSTIMQLAVYITTNRVSGVFAMIPDENKVRLIDDITHVPLSLLVYHIGIEEGEKCSSKVIFAGSSCGQQTKIILELLRKYKISSVYIIASLTPVSQTCLKVMEFVFEENGVLIVGSIDILGDKNEDGIPVAEAVKGSINNEDDDPFFIINIAEGKFYPAILYGLNKTEMNIFTVINTFINEYHIKAVHSSLLDLFPEQYFVVVFHNEMKGSVIKEIKNVFTTRINRDNDIYVTSNFFIIHNLFKLYVKAVTYSQSTDPRYYQKFIYNHPIVSENDIYLIASSNYADTQLYIVKIGTPNEEYHISRGVFRSAPFVNRTIQCNFAQINTDLNYDQISKINAYVVIILFDPNEQSHVNYVIDFEFIFQIINELKINGRSVLLSYYTVDSTDEESYLRSVEQAYDDYGEDLLCFITSLLYLFVTIHLF